MVSVVVLVGFVIDTVITSVVAFVDSSVVTSVVGSFDFSVVTSVFKTVSRNVGNSSSPSWLALSIINCFNNFNEFFNTNAVD